MSTTTTEIHPSNLEDPFSNYSLFSLLPQHPFSVVSSHVETAHSDSNELDSLRTFFKSMALKAPGQVLEQAQTIINSCANHQNRLSYDGEKDFAANAKDRAQGRRPGLGRKRARFSMMPTSSQPLPNVDISSSIDHIEDPDEYFLAFEQLENADRELKKLRGEVSTDLMENNRATTARKRRPGLLGKTACYKHNFSANADTVEALVESQEEPRDRRNHSASKTSMGMELNNVLDSKATIEPGACPAKETNSEHHDAAEREGSGADELDNILENLLDGDEFKDLDEDEGAKLLRERLQIKSIDVGKLRLPEMGSIQKFDDIALNNRLTCGKLKDSHFPQISSNILRSPQGAISTLLRRSSLKDRLGDLYSVPLISGSSFSCSPPSTGLVKKSLPPQGAISPLLRRSSLKDQMGDLYSAPHISGSSFSCSPPSTGLVKKSLPPKDIDNQDKNALGFDKISQLLQNGTLLTSDENLHSPVADADMTMGSKITSEEELAEHPTCLHEDTTVHDSGGVNNEKDILFTRLDDSLQEGKNMQLDILNTDQLDTGTGLTSGSISHTGTEDLASPPSAERAENCSSPGVKIADGFSELGDVQAEVNGTVQETVMAPEASKENTCPPGPSPLMDPHLESSCGLSKDSNEGLKQKTPLRKAPLQRHNTKRKSAAGRKSLADAGLKWDSGVRRSSRIKSRPLEYWRGERFLYGRIHDSLATVIGIKYASPQKDTREPVLKVKSFVSEDYADLVAQAALH